MHNQQTCTVVHSQRLTCNARSCCSSLAFSASADVWSRLISASSAARWTCACCSSASICMFPTSCMSSRNVLSKTPAPGCRCSRPGEGPAYSEVETVLCVAVVIPVNHAYDLQLNYECKMQPVFVPSADITSKGIITCIRIIVKNNWFIMSLRQVQSALSRQEE